MNEKDVKKQELAYAQALSTEDSFLDKVDELFHVADAKDLIDNDEDKFFLKIKENPDVQAAWYGLTKSFCKKRSSRQVILTTVGKRKRRSQLEIHF